MKRINKNVIGLSLSLAFVLSSCGDDFDFESHYPGAMEKQEYTKNWVEQFGEIDPNHTWNACKSYEVTVSTPESSNIQIYALDGDCYKIVANYEDVMGEQTLKFDALAGVSDIYVSNGFTAIPAKVGETVNFGGTRAGIYSPTIDGVEVSKNTDESKYKTFTYAQYQSWENDKLPQDQDNLPHLEERNIIGNFTYVTNTEEIIIYPISYGTTHASTIGIYYYKDGSKVEIPIYSIKSGDELQFKTNSPITPSESAADDINSRTESVYKNSAKYQAILNDPGYVNGSFVPAQWSRGLFGWHMTSPAQYRTTSWTDCFGNYVKDLNPTQLRSKGIKVNIGKGIEIGVYINTTYTNGGSGKYYSQSSLNTESLYNNEDKIMAATFSVDLNGTMTQVFGMENGALKSRENYQYDLNDVMLMIDGVVPVDQTAYEWIIACEDLGESDDYDFNDLVVKVKHINGQGTAQVTPLAAGGVLEAHYGFGDDKTISQSTEIHGKLKKGGQSAGLDPEGKYYMINTNYDATHDGYNGTEESITVDPYNFTLTQNMGGFWIKVKGENGNYQLITAPKTALHQDEEGSTAPQMILLPFGWRWPKERVAISEAYRNFHAYNSDQSRAETLGAWNADVVTNKVYQYNY